METVIDSSENLGVIVARYPLAHRVFMKYNIDFCCGGKRSLEDAVSDKPVSAEAILEEIQNSASNDKNEVNWDEKSPAELIDHIIEDYHKPLLVSLKNLDTLSEKVLKAHFESHGAMLSQLREVILAFRTELLNHMQKEEQILFPMILKGLGQNAGSPIRVMEHEHEEAAVKLSQIRELTGDFTVPDDACETFKALWKELEIVDRELRIHIHLENNILFPKVLAA